MICMNSQYIVSPTEYLYEYHLALRNYSDCFHNVNLIGADILYMICRNTEWI